MNNIDKRLLDMLYTKSTLEWLRKENSDLKESAFKNYHYVLLKKWLLIIGIISASGVIGFIIGLAMSFSSSSTSSIDLTLFDSLNKTIIAPSITIMGLFITFTPVICFFFLSELKEIEKESNEDTEKIRKAVFGEEEEIAELEIRTKYENVFFYNFRSGILKYLQTYVTIALFSLLFVLLAYVGLSSVLFIFTDILILAFLLTGIFPIISVALYKPSLTLLTIFFKEGKREIITNL